MRGTADRDGRVSATFGPARRFSGPAGPCARGLTLPRWLEALREHERAEAASHCAEMTAWKNKHALWKGGRDRLLAEARNGNGEKRAAAEADLEALGPEPVAPPVADRIDTEPTFEGLTRRFAEGLPSLGIFSDEGGQFLGGHGMNRDNRQKTLSALNALWGGDPIRRTPGRARAPLRSTGGGWPCISWFSR